LATRCGHVEVLDKLWKWAKEEINTDLNNYLLLAKDEEKKSPESRIIEWQSTGIFANKEVD